MPSKWLPELDNRRLVYVLIALGLVGVLTELVSTMFAPRLVLYVFVLSLGAFGLARRWHAGRRMHPLMGRHQG